MPYASTYYFMPIDEQLIKKNKKNSAKMLLSAEDRTRTFKYLLIKID